MIDRLLNSWELIRSSYWFVPTVLVLGSLGLAQVSILTDALLARYAPGATDWLRNVGPEEARATLSIISGSMMTVASIVFSIVIIAMTLASQLYGPRLMRGLMGDRVNQTVLGVFIATFLYSLAIMRAMPATLDGGTLPRVSLVIAVLLSILSIGVLIYFIHHVSIAMTAPHIVEIAGRELDRAIDSRFGKADEPAPEDEDLPADFDDRCRSLRPSSRGYLRRIAEQDLCKLLAEHDLVLRHPGIGAYFGHGLSIDVAPADKVTDDLADEILERFLIGPTRTGTQDPFYAVEAIGQIAARALSPSLNDPFTAMLCIDRLAACLARIDGRPDPTGILRDEQDRLRAKASPFTFADLLHAAFDPIRRDGAGQHAVVHRLLTVLGDMAAVFDEPARREALAEMADRTLHACVSRDPDDPGLKEILEQHARTMQRLGARAGE